MKGVEIEIIEKIVIRSEKKEVFIYEGEKRKGYGKVSMNFTGTSVNGRYNWMNVYLDKENDWNNLSYHHLNAVK